MENNQALYWASTPDHAEDYLVIAESTFEAKVCHALDRMYDLDEITLEFIRNIPTEIEVESGWVDYKMISKLGGTIIKLDTPMIIEFNGKIYHEGYDEYLFHKSCDDASEALGEGRPFGTLCSKKN